MVNIYDLPLFYISFKEDKELEEHYKYYGFKNVGHFPAVNGKKLNKDKLRSDKLISIRCYDDLKSVRRQSAGMPSLGGIGCTLSHYELWCKCIDEDWPYIIIAEEDNRMKRISEKDREKIEKHMEKTNSMFVSKSLGNRGSYTKALNGTHLCIVSLGACKVLKDHCFPIDVQTDWYVAHLGSVNKINLEGFPVSRQNHHVSSIQSMCPTCILPRSNLFYYCIVGGVAIIIVIILILRRKINSCEKSCK